MEKDKALNELHQNKMSKSFIAIISSKYPSLYFAYKTPPFSLSEKIIHSTVFETLGGAKSYVDHNFKMKCGGGVFNAGELIYY